MKSAKDDAPDCVCSLARARSQRDWPRFDARLYDFLAQHRNELSMAALRSLLADGYAAIIPEDRDGHRRILKQ